jgi:hypothetical protein
MAKTYKNWDTKLKNQNIKINTLETTKQTQYDGTGTVFKTELKQNPKKGCKH